MKETPELTKEDSERIQNLFIISVDILCAADFNGYFRLVNPAFEKISGYTRKELLGKVFLDFIYPDDRDASTAELQKLSRGEPSIYFENRYQCKDGSLKWIGWTAVPVPEEGLLYAVGHEITERKQMEEKLKDYAHGLESKVEDRTQEIAARMHELQERDEMIRKLSTPVVEVADGVVLLPVVGILDSARAKQLTEEVMECLARTRANVIVIDISGIAAIDTKSASNILRTVQAARLMGSEAIITGIRPDVAVTLVTLGIDLSGIVTRSTLREGLEYAYEKLGLKLVEDSRG